ncbi:MAG: response regulator [Dehalococcoidia bacterium]|jgi:DNA-binding response OmpR family regulator
MRILLVEDDTRLAGIIRRGLVEEGYSTDCVYDGEQARYLAEIVPYDLVILDIMLPKKDGIVVCKELRAKQLGMPILMLTAKDSVEDRVKGLDSGADEYMTKPFAFSDLLARVRALLQRDTLFTRPNLQPGDIA